VPRRTRFTHRRQRSGPPPRRRSAAAPARQGSATDGRAGGGGSGTSDGNEVDENAFPAPPEPNAQRPNGVCISPESFQKNMDDFVAYNFVVQHCL